MTDTNPFIEHDLHMSWPALARAIWHMIEANRSVAYEAESIAFDILAAESRQWDKPTYNAFIEKWTRR
jgi:hypothetical protein